MFGYPHLTLKEGSKVKSDHINRFPGHDFLQVGYNDLLNSENLKEATVEPQLSEHHGRHTIRSDNRGVRIDEGNRNLLSVGYRVGDN